MTLLQTLVIRGAATSSFALRLALPATALIQPGKEDTLPRHLAESLLYPEPFPRPTSLFQQQQF
jgi:hypothetical protein